MKGLIPYAIAALLSAGTVRAQETAPAITPVPAVYAHSELLSQWIARGMPYSEGSVSQLLGNLTHKGVSVTAFANVDEKNQITEGDLFLGYGKRFGNVDLYGEAALIDYHHSDLRSTCELALKATLDTAFKPHLQIVRDVIDIRGTYAEVGIEQSTRVMGKDVTATLNTGYNDGYYRDGSGLSHIEFKLAIPLAKGAVTPTLTYSQPLDGDFERLFGVGLRLSWAK